MAIPAACFGSYRRRLLVGSCWPVAFVCIVTFSFVVRAVTRASRSASPFRSRARLVCGSIYAGVERALPLILVVTYILVPSTSTQIFKTFKCDKIEYDDSTLVARRYLHDDLEMRCDSDEPGEYHGTGRCVAFGHTISLRIIAVREPWCSAARSVNRTNPCDGSAFLSDDYDVTGLGVWWELFETVCFCG
eukprot:1016310-Prymnesium_polylepis.1